MGNVWMFINDIGTAIQNKLTSFNEEFEQIGIF